jgi:hypothetical protein
MKNKLTALLEIVIVSIILWVLFSIALANFSIFDWEYNQRAAFSMINGIMILVISAKNNL